MFRSCARVAFHPAAVPDPWQSACCSRFANTRPPPNGSQQPNPKIILHKRHRIACRRKHNCEVRMICGTEYGRAEPPGCKVTCRREAPDNLMVSDKILRRKHDVHISANCEGSDDGSHLSSAYRVSRGGGARRTILGAEDDEPRPILDPVNAQPRPIFNNDPGPILGTDGMARAVPVFKTHRLILQVNTNDPAAMNLALNNATNVTQHYKKLGEKVKIEVITFGPGLHMLRDDTSPVKARIEQMALSTPEVSFKACGITREKMHQAEHKDISIVSQAQVVKSGVVRVMELQEKGWNYVKP